MDSADIQQEKEEQIKEIIEEQKQEPTKEEQKLKKQIKERKELDAYDLALRQAKEENRELTLEEKKLLAKRIEEEKEEEEKKKNKNKFIVDTTKERGIDADKMNLTAREYLEKNKDKMTLEQIKEWETKAQDEEEEEQREKEQQEELKEIQKNKGKKDNTLDDSQLTPEEVFAETELRIKQAIAKDKRGEKLNKEEMQLLVLHTEIMKAEQMLADRLNSADEINAEKEKQNIDLRKHIIKEYKTVLKKNPELVIRNGLGPKQEGFVVGKNFLKSVGFIVSTHWSMKYGYCKLVKIWKDKGVEEIYLKKMPKFVEFWSKNERGEDVVNICKVRVLNYRLQGTTIPICYAVEGFIDAYDFFGNMRDEYTQELFQKALLLGYWSGILKGKETFPDQKEESFWSKYKLLLILGGVLLLLIGLAYYGQLQQINSMNEQITVLTNLLKASQIDANAILVKGGQIATGAV